VPDKLVIVDGSVFVDIGGGYLVLIATTREFLAMEPEERAEMIALVKLTHGMKQQ
jgi:hypothetical protein